MIRPPHIAALDGIRGLAILVVLVHNAGFILRESELPGTKLVMAGTAAGWTGVQLFFVLSGFLITGILLDGLGKPRFFSSFYARRTLRIFPLYYAFLLVALLVVPLFADPAWAASAREKQWWYWTYLANWSAPFGGSIPGLSHFWSLAVEEQFYLLWPLLVFVLGQRGLGVLALALIALTPLIRLLLHSLGFPPLALYDFTVCRWDALAAGAVLAVLLRQDAGRRWLARRMDPMTIALLVASLALLLAERGFQEWKLSVQLVGQSLVALLAASLIYNGVAGGGRVASLVRNGLSAGWLRFLGKYSYAIYVFHFPIHMLLVPRAADLVNGADTYGRLLRLGGYILVVAALSISAALISWRVLEKPLLDLKERLAPRAG